MSAKDCEKCNTQGSVVKDSRTYETGRLAGILQRRRMCVKCEYRWTTVEVDREEYEALHVALEKEYGDGS